MGVQVGSVKRKKCVCVGAMHVSAPAWGKSHCPLLPLQCTHRGCITIPNAGSMRQAVVMGGVVAFSVHAGVHMSATPMVYPCSTVQRMRSYPAPVVGSGSSPVRHNRGLECQLPCRVVWAGGKRCCHAQYSAMALNGRCPCLPTRPFPLSPPSQDDI